MYFDLKKFSNFYCLSRFVMPCHVTLIVSKQQENLKRKRCTKKKIINTLFFIFITSSRQLAIHLITTKHILATLLIRMRERFSRVFFMDTFVSTIIIIKWMIIYIFLYYLHIFFCTFIMLLLFLALFVKISYWWLFSVCLSVSRQRSVGIFFVNIFR